MVSAATKHERISCLLNDSLLVTGSKGSGKTRTIHKLIKELLEQGKKICLLDFVGTYRDLSSEFGETFVDQLSLENILNSERNLYRITFNKDVLFFKEKCNMNFLKEIYSEIDYLIVDEAQHLFFRADEFEIEHLLNKGTKVILALETLECFEFTQVLKLKRMMNELMFRQNQNDLAYLKDGEALLVREHNIIRTINLSEERECFG